MPSNCQPTIFRNSLLSGSCLRNGWDGLFRLRFLSHCGPQGRFFSALAVLLHTEPCPAPGWAFKLCIRVKRAVVARLLLRQATFLCAQLWAHARAAMQRAKLAAPLARLNNLLSQAGKAPRVLPRLIRVASREFLGSRTMILGGALRIFSWWWRVPAGFSDLWFLDDVAHGRGSRNR